MPQKPFGSSKGPVTFRSWRLSQQFARIRDIVVPRTVELLRSMGQMPTASKLEVPDITVGLQGKVDRVLQLLAGGGRSCMVLLHGAGGVGKSTLARAVFNQLHEQNPGMACHAVALGPATQSASSIVQAQCSLLQHLCTVEDAVVHSADEGRMVLSQNMEGKTVLLLLDDVWGDSLSLLLPRRLTELLGEGSTVLVTSREAGAVRLFDEGHGMLELEVQYLSQQESIELFCSYAFGCSRPPAGEEDRVRLVVATCGGLPMALEVVGRYLARVADQREFWMQFERAVQLAYGGQRAGRLESERTLFGAVAVSWNALASEEKDTLLDIVWVLRGQPWELVEAYCQYGVLRRLHELGLVTQLPEDDQKEGSAVRVGVPDIIMDFCKVGIHGYRGRWLDLQSSDLEDGDALTRLLVEGGDIRSLRARQLRMEGGGHVAVERQLPSLRALHVEDCDKRNQLVVSLLNLRWLCLKGAPMLRELQFQGTSALRVVILCRLHQLQKLQGLQDCPALRVLQINFCEKLQQVDLRGLADLEQLQLLACRQLLKVSGLEGLDSLEQLELWGCEQLQRVDLRGLTALERLQIQRCPELLEVDGLEVLDTLELLEVAHCPKLRHMDLKGLTALRQLEIQAYGQGPSRQLQGPSRHTIGQQQQGPSKLGRACNVDVAESIVSVVKLGVQAYDAYRGLVKEYKADKELVRACGDSHAYDIFMGQLKDYRAKAQELGGEDEGGLRARLEALNTVLVDQSNIISEQLVVAKKARWYNFTPSRAEAIDAIKNARDTLDSRFKDFSTWFDNSHLQFLRTKAILRMADTKEQLANTTQQRDAQKLLKDWKDAYPEIKRNMIVVNDWLVEFGLNYGLAVYKDPALRVEADKIRESLGRTWKDVQDGCSSISVFADLFFSSTNRLMLAAEYRQKAEQLDIANWYYQQKNFDSKTRKANHYITGTNPLDAPNEYLFNAAGQAVEVKDNNARPGRFQLIQERELAALAAGGADLSAGSPALTELDSLALARLLKHMGVGDTGVSFIDDISRWPATVKDALIEARQRAQAAALLRV